MSTRGNLAAVTLALGVLISLFVPSARAADCDSLPVSPLALATWSVPSDPWGVAIDPQGYVFVTDPVHHRICRTTESGQSPIYFGSQGNGAGQFQEPRWLAFDGARGLLYVSDQERNGVMVFDREGFYLRTVGGGSLSSNPGSLSGPNEAIALDAAGNLYIAEINTLDSTFRARIQVFDPAGNFQRVFAQSSSCPMTPTAGSWCQFAGMSIAPNGELFALEWAAPGASFHYRVHRFASSGAALGVWGEDGPGAGRLHYAFGLACGNDGNVWVSCNDQLLQFSPTGTLIGNLRRDGTRDFQGITLAPGPVEKIFVGTFRMLEPAQQLEVLAKPILAHNALDSHWLDSNGHLVPVAPALLGECDDANVLRSGVCADGVSPLVLRYEFTEPCTVIWTLTDDDSASGGDELGSLASVDGVQSGRTITVSSVLVNDRHTAFVVYTAPIDFERPDSPGDTELGTRTVRVRMQATSLSAADSADLWRAVKIVRPPVAFVHGIWSQSAAWNDFKSMRYPADPRWRTYRVDYSSSHSQAFAYNAGRLLSGLRGVRILHSRNLDVATAQVDLVTHSMGGCIARTLAGTPSYRRAGNLGAGDFHKLLTLNTPHFGSPLAASLVTLRAATYAGLTESRPAALALSQLLAGIVHVPLEDFQGPAIDDLSPGSPALSALGPLNVPAHAHVGQGGSDLAATLALGTGGHPVEAAYVALGVLTANLGIAEFLIEPHDGIVLDRSQRGGLAPSQVFTSHFLDGLHTEAPRIQATGDLAREWALRPVSDAGFFGTLPAVTTGGPLIAKSNFAVPPYGGKTLTLSPGSGSAAPGEDYTVTVQAAAGTTLADAIVAYPGGVLRLHAPNLTGTVHIPVDSYGTLELSCMGLTSDGHLVDGTGAWVNIDQAGPPDSISVEPRQLDFSGPGEVQPVHVLAHFPDGVARDLANVQGSISFGGYNAAVLRSLAGRGELQAMRAGATTVTVTFAGLTCELEVVVHDGERVTNPPHAVISPPGSYCAGRENCLLGSASYDDDTPFGDALSYHWDLDNDGQFDDAQGPSACLTPQDGSEDLLVALEVVDAEGLRSQDMIRLSPQGGYCHDAIGVCQVGSANHGYPAFGMVWDIGLDASGRFYVLVLPWSPGPGRVVRFTRDCQYDGEISVPITVHRIAVSPAGVVYAVDLSDVPQIRRFARDGSELSPIMLPAVSQDAPYEQYQDDIDFDEAGNICVPVETYWATEESTGLDDYAVHTIDDAGQLVRRVAADADLGIAVDNDHPVMSFKVAADGTLFFTQRTAVYRAHRTGNTYALDLTIPGGSRFHLAEDATAAPDGTIYVDDLSRVHQFTPDGTFTSTRTGAGISPVGDGFAEIRAFEVDASKRIYVAEFYGRAEVFRFEPEDLTGVDERESPPQPAGEWAGLRFANPYRPLTPIMLGHTADRAPVHVLIYSVQGGCVRSLSLGPAGPGPMTFTWDGRSSRGARVAPGVYYVRAVVGKTVYQQKLVLIR